MPRPKVEPTIVWNEQEVIQLLGKSPTKLNRMLEEIGHPLPSKWAFYQWRSRGNVSEIWLPVVVYVLMRAGLLDQSRVFRRRTSAPEPEPQPEAA